MATPVSSEYAVDDWDDLPMPRPGAKLQFSYENYASEEDVLSLPSRKLYQFDGTSLIRNDNVVQDSLFFGDNIHILQCIRGGSVRPRLIYLDPPYSTGGSFNTRNQRHSYNDKFDHVQYVEFLRRRLILCRDLLADDGSIYVHVGHQAVGVAKVLLDHIFGSDSFRSVVTRRKCSSKNFTSKSFPDIHDYILFYTKSKTYVWNQPSTKPSSDWLEREYPKVDDLGRRFKLVPVHAPGERNGATGTAWRGKMPPKGKHWQYVPDKLDQLDQAGDIHWSRNGNPRRKVYLSPDKTVPYTNYLLDFRDAHHQSIKVTGYPTEKNQALLELLIEASSEKGDMVLDPFAGSGTTASAAIAKGRSYQIVDSSTEAIIESYKRIVYGSDAMGDFVNERQAKDNYPLVFATQSPNLFVQEEFAYSQFMSEVAPRLSEASQL